MNGNDGPSEKGAPAIYEVVVETPRGSRNKYKIDEKTGRLKLGKVLPEGMVFPYDCGYFPGTIGGDGDPLDVVVLSDASTFAGCAIDCPVVGVLMAEQRKIDEISGKKVRNDRIIAVAESSLCYQHVGELADLPKSLANQLEQFFVNYLRGEGVEVIPLGIEGAAAAEAIVKNASAR